MSDETSDLDEMLGFLAEERRDLRDPEEHPSPETLTAYQANELSPEEDEQIQSHLRVCKHCTQMLLDLEEFLRPAEAGVEPAADFEAAADWRKLREGIPLSPGKKRPAPAPGREDRLLRSLRVFQGLAAVLGVLVIGLSAYTVRSQARFEGPRLIPEKTLEFSLTRGADQHEETIRLPQALRFVVASDDPGYRIEIASANGSRVYSEGPVQRSDLDSLILPLPKGLLSPGTYIVRLYGLRPGQPEEPLGKPLKLLIQP